MHSQNKKIILYSDRNVCTLIYTPLNGASKYNELEVKKHDNYHYLLKKIS